MKKRGKLTYSIFIGLSMVALGFSGNPAMAQTTSLTSDSISLSSFKPKPKPKPVSVPEPASAILLGAGLAGLGIWKRASRKD
jgi:hypothetical protein